MNSTRLFPRPDPALLVLTSLADGPKHGYALMKDIEAFSHVSMGPGTVFGCLARLEERGLVRALEAEDRRHPYELTATGLAVLHEQLDELGRVTATSRARLRLARPARPNGGRASG
jgi:DNA-binding PadR family transcriptional regulator